MKSLSVAVIFGCFLAAGYGDWAKCNAQQLDKADPAPQEDPGARNAAVALAYQLGAPTTEVRENAARALEAMGPQARKALAKYISDELSGETLENAVTRMQGITKAATILGKIGKGISEDTEVRLTLLSATKSNVRVGESEQPMWHKLQMRLAAIEALGKINEHRGDIFAKDLDTSELAQAKDACDASDASADLERIAEELLNRFGKEKKPAAEDPKRDEDFYHQLKILREAQPKIIKIAAQIKAAAPLSKTTTEPIPSKLTDADELEKSVHKIYSSYLKATKKAESANSNADDPKKGKEKTAPDEADGVPAAYDMLTEARQLSQQLPSLCKEMGTLENDRVALSQLISDLGTIREGLQLESTKRDSDDIKAEVAKAVNRIFSKPPAEKPTPETTKKETTKKDATKKDAK